MIGIVDVGGGLRGVYGAGVFDTCLEEKLTFDYLIGVSAGSANVASFLAGQRGRNLRFYTDYAFRKAYMSLGNFLRRGNYLDLDYIYGGTLSNTGGEDPLDYDAMAANPAQAKVVATDAATGPAGVLRLPRHGPGRLRGHQGQLLRAGGQPALLVEGAALLRRRHHRPHPLPEGPGRRL